MIAHIRVAVGNSDSDTPTTKLVHKKEEIKENSSVVQEAEKVEGKIVEGKTSKSENDQEKVSDNFEEVGMVDTCLLYTSPSPRDATLSRMPSSA